jgi:iron-sulfur cluster repair protein YtfE (RIC family)
MNDGVNGPVGGPEVDRQVFDGVSDYLGWDHDRLDALLVRAERELEAERPQAATECFRAFRDGLTRHIRIEEELLFPLFEARTGVAAGPTEVMRSEHREIERALELMERGLAAGSVERFEEGRRFLAATLVDHNAKEEHILYPTMDRLLSDSERAAFTRRMQSE